MRVCVPTMDDAGPGGAVSEHFGRAAYFTVVDTDAGTFEVVCNAGSGHGGGCGGMAVLEGVGVDVVICQGLGEGALGRWSRFGVPVYRAVSGDVAGCVDALLAGSLVRVGPGDVHGHHGDAGHGRAGRGGSVPGGCCGGH